VRIFDLQEQFLPVVCCEDKGTSKNALSGQVLLEQERVKG
jgi:hypothetical protein